MALAGGIVLATVLMWSFANFESCGVFTFSSAGDWNLYFVRTVTVLRRETGLPAHQIERDQVSKMVRDLDLPSSAKRKAIDDFLPSTDADMISYWRSESIDAAIRYKTASVGMTAVATERRVCWNRSLTRERLSSND